jgi:hypothetical protein
VGENRGDLFPTIKLKLEDLMKEWGKFKDNVHLKEILDNTDPSELTEDETTVLLVWTAPLNWKVTEKNELSKRARYILGVDNIEALSLIKISEY